MQIIIDKGIPFLQGVFPSEIEVKFLSPEEINSESVRKADALFVRTRTQINKELLHGSQVRFVATATIGFDHIDQDYCREAGIHWVSCPGCNAQAVCDYVEEAIATYSAASDSPQSGRPVGGTPSYSSPCERPIGKAVQYPNSNHIHNGANVFANCANLYPLLQTTAKRLAYQRMPLSLCGLVCQLASMPYRPYR